MHLKMMGPAVLILSAFLLTSTLGTGASAAGKADPTIMVEPTSLPEVPPKAMPSKSGAPTARKKLSTKRNKTDPLKVIEYPKDDMNKAAPQSRTQ